jgi:hypothetical protein
VPIKKVHLFKNLAHNYCTIKLLVDQTMSTLTLKPEFWTQGPNSWDSTCQVRTLAPICQVKRHGVRQRKEIYHMAQDMPWEEAE